MADSNGKSKNTRARPLQNVPWTEVRKAIRRQWVASLGLAFGALIGFMWTGVVQQAFVAAGVIINGSVNGWVGWIAYAAGAIVVTFVAVIMLLVIAKIQGQTEQK